MSAEHNLATIRHYFDVITGLRQDRDLPSFFSDDIVWAIPPSNTALLPNPRVGKAAVLDLLGSGVGVYMPGSLVVEMQNLFGDAEQVAAQFTLHATLANGADYHNQYVFVFRLSNGLITHVWEYLDTLYLKERGGFA